MDKQNEAFPTQASVLSGNRTVSRPDIAGKMKVTLAGFRTIGCGAGVGSRRKNHPDADQHENRAKQEGERQRLAAEPANPTPIAPGGVMSEIVCRLPIFMRGSSQ